MEMAPSPDKTLSHTLDTVDAFMTDRSEPNEMDMSVTDEDKIQNPETNIDPTTEQATAPAPTPAPVSPLLIGTMTYVGGIVYCKGKWGMSKDAHNTPGQTSDFEFKLIKAEDSSSGYPINGKYQGWFHIKQAPPLKGQLKIEDKEMNITFSSADDGEHIISGEGYNKFGRFYLRGTHFANGTVQIYRDYYLTTYQPPVLKRAKTESKKEPKLPGDIPAAPITTPREGSGRVRKQSFVLKEYQETVQKPVVFKAEAPSSSSVTVTTTVMPMTIAPPTLARHNTDRQQRLSSAMKKCLDVLRDLSRTPQAIWFLEPVDPVALNIPEYPKIVKYPMDFGTIRSNIENSLYEGINDFAGHVRLVFKNATTFNQDRENPVHIAARDLSERFERSYRQLVAQLAPDEYALLPQMETSRMSLGGKGSKKTPKGKEGGVMMKTPRGAIGARQGNMFSGLPPAAYDSSTQKILEMERMMNNMKDELEQLRATVRVSEAHKFVEEAKAAAQNPLTLDEKKHLITAIHNLPPQKMEEVLDIIQRSLPPGSDNGGEIQVPLDSLDTLTLRKLQAFIAETGCVVDKKKKRPASNAADGSNKKPRKKPSTGGAMSTSHGDLTIDCHHDAHDDDALLFGHDDDALLFESETLDDDVHPTSSHNQKSAELQPENSGGGGTSWGKDAAIHASSSGSHTTVADEEDDGDDGWNMAAAELRSKQLQDFE